MSGIEDVDIRRLRNLGILVLFLGISLALLFGNRSQSYEKYKRIQFESSGAQLYANIYYPRQSIEFQDKHPLVFWVHGIGNSRDLDLRIPVELTKRGFFVVTIDYQGHGESEGDIDNIDPETGKPAIAEDCSKLLDVLEDMPFFEKEIDDSQIGLVGHSLGGMIVLMTQALDSRFKATVAWNPLVDPEVSEIPIGEDYEKYYPINFLNENNTKNLLIIAHVYDECLSFKKNALAAHKLTDCELIEINYPLLGGGHAMLADEAVVETIKWFEDIFFGSVSKNGPIILSYYFNYILIALSLILLFMTIFALVYYSAKFFNLEKKSKQAIEPHSPHELSKIKKIFQCFKIIAAIAFFINLWVWFVIWFGLFGLFYASAIIFFTYIVGKLLLIYYKKYKKTGKEFHLGQLIKSQVNKSAFIFSIVSSIYFLSLYFVFSFSYPFAFVFPSNMVTILVAHLAVPLYFSLELLYRKVIYPQLHFIKSEVQRTKIIVLIALIVHMLLIVFTWSWAFFPVVILFYLIFLLVVIFNSIIYEQTHNFTSTILSSYGIIVIYFGAIISTAMGVGSALSYFVKF